MVLYAQKYGVVTRPRSNVTAIQGVYARGKVSQVVTRPRSNVTAIDLLSMVIMPWEVVTRPRSNVTAIIFDRSFKGGFTL